MVFAWWFMLYCYLIKQDFEIKLRYYVLVIR